MGTVDLQQENERLRFENELCKQLGSYGGFFDFYFNSLPNFKSNKDTFWYANNLYKDFFGDYRYRNYNSFRDAYYQYVNKKPKG